MKGHGFERRYRARCVASPADAHGFNNDNNNKEMFGTDAFGGSCLWGR